MKIVVFLMFFVPRTLFIVNYNEMPGGGAENIKNILIFAIFSFFCFFVLYIFAGD